MYAMVLTGHGDFDRLEYRTSYPVPTPGADEVLIRVTACGMNNTDINTRTGWYSKAVTTATEADETDSGVDGSWGGGLSFPRIQGADPVGAIVAVGDNVDVGRIGCRAIIDAWMRDPSGRIDRARYLGSELDGGFAEYVVVPSSNAHKIESDRTDVELASFPCSYATAEHMLHRCNLEAGQWVLITGASGGVGGALIQLAKRREAQVIAVTSVKKASAVSNLGADVVLDRSDPDLADLVVDCSSGVDVFADVVGGAGFAPLFETIRRGGQYVTAGAIAGPIVRLDLRTLYLNDLTMHGATVLPPEVFANLVGYIERDEIKPLVAATYPLDQMVDAQRAFVKKDHVGSIVMEIV